MKSPIFFIAPAIPSCLCMCTAHHSLLQHQDSLSARQRRTHLPEPATNTEKQASLYIILLKGYKLPFYTHTSAFALPVSQNRSLSFCYERTVSEEQAAKETEKSFTLPMLAILLDSAEENSYNPRKYESPSHRH